MESKEMMQLLGELTHKYAPRAPFKTPAGNARGLHLDGAFRRNASWRIRATLDGEAFSPEFPENSEDAIIAELDGDTDSGVSPDEETFVRPEPYVRRRREGAVRMVSINESGRKILTTDRRPVVAEPVQEAEASDPAPSEHAEARSEILPVLTYGERRTCLLVRKDRNGHPRLKKVDIRPPRLRPQAKPGAPRRCACGTDFLPPQHAPNASLCRSCHQKEMRKLPTRTCKCGKTFHPPVVAPDATLCRDCHKKEREAAKKRWEAKRPHIEAMQTMRESKMAHRIKEAVRNGKSLPAGVILKKDDGRKVTVEFHGKPLEVVYRMRSGKTERKRQARRWRHEHAA